MVFRAERQFNFLKFDFQYCNAKELCAAYFFTSVLAGMLFEGQMKLKIQIMKASAISTVLAGLILLLYACIKSSGITGAPITTVDLKGTWNVDYYVAANIYASNSARKDTTYAKHKETWTLNGDSLYTDFWYSTRFDQTKSPPVLSESDTTETRRTFAGKYNGQQILAQSANRTDTIDIVTLTNSQLQIHQAMTPGLGFADLYITLKR